MHFRGDNSKSLSLSSLLTSVSLSLSLSLCFSFRKEKYYRVPFKGDDESKTWWLDQGRRDKIPREMS